MYYTYKTLGNYPEEVSGQPMQNIFRKDDNAFIPLDVFEEFLQTLSQILPSTHSLSIVRNVISGGIFQETFYELGNLFFITFIFVVLGCFLFKTSIKLTKKYGNMSFF